MTAAQMARHTGCARASKHEKTGDSWFKKCCALSRSFFCPESRKPSREGASSCTHHVRIVDIYAACCGKYFPCRHCRDEQVHGEHSDFEKGFVTKVRCRSCHVEQDVSDCCKTATCGLKFADLACLECRLFDSTPGVIYFHCEQCGVCRLGRREDSFHSGRCDTCVGSELVSPHACVGGPFRPLQQQQQPVPARDSHDDEVAATDRVVRRDRAFMPLCVASARVLVRCADCGARSHAKYHYEFLKCRAGGDGCGSYNTTRIGDFESRACKR